MNQNKTALVTGGTSGVGLSVAKGLLKSKHTVYVIGSNLEKGKLAESQLLKSFPEKIKFIQLDLSNLESVRNFANDFLNSHPHLDVLVNSAGVMLPKRKETSEGNEMTFAVNYLSTFILSTVLAPLLERADNGRICNVAGSPRFVYMVKLNFDDLQFKNNYNRFRAAITSIHAKTVLTQILSEKYIEKGIDVNCFHPGAVRSDLAKKMKWLAPVVNLIQKTVMKEDSLTGIYVTNDQSLNGVTGKFFDNQIPLSLTYDSDYKEKLWSRTLKITNSKSKVL